MKRFIVSGKEYARLAGKPTVDIPPPEIQLQQKEAYLEYSKGFAANAGGTTVPPEALIPNLHQLFRDNLERFARAEPLTNQVSTGRGY